MINTSQKPDFFLKNDTFQKEHIKKNYEKIAYGLHC